MIYVYQANIGVITVHAGTFERTETFRTGPAFNNRSAKAGIRTSDKTALIDHVTRHERLAFDRGLQARLRAAVNAAVAGDEIELGDMRVVPVTDPRLM